MWSALFTFLCLNNELYKQSCDNFIRVRAGHQQNNLKAFQGLKVFKDFSSVLQTEYNPNIVNNINIRVA
jgi:hypothetical protein